MAPGNIFNVFARSPIRPLQQHMAKVYACASELMGFFAAVYDHDWQKADEEQQKIVALEHQADEIKQDMRAHLPKGLFLPVSRGDLLEILTTQDRIANKAKDIAGLIIGRKMPIPETITIRFLDLLKCSIAAVDQSHKAICELDELLETGFRGNEVHIVEEMINKIAETEHESDEIQIDVRRQLYKIEQDLSPVDVIFIYKIIDWVGDIADRAEQVGNRLQLLLAR